MSHVFSWKPVGCEGRGAVGFTAFFRLKDFRLKAVRDGHGTRLGREKVRGSRCKVFLFGRLGPALL